MAYLDYNSTMPVDRQVVEVMVPIFNERFGNPSSVGHETGRAAGGLLEDALRPVGQAVGMRAPGVIFTSGATEANNLAFMGLRRGLGRPIRMLVGATEHKSALQTCRALEEDGSALNIIPVSNDGLIDLPALNNALTDDTDVVSVMAANSETGILYLEYFEDGITKQKYCGPDGTKKAMLKALQLEYKHVLEKKKELNERSSNRRKRMKGLK